MEEGNKKYTRYITVKDWPKYHNWPPNGGLRDLIFKAKKNGFDKVIKRVGRRVVIDEDAFFAWMKERPNMGGKGEYENEF